MMPGNNNHLWNYMLYPQAFHPMPNLFDPPFGVSSPNYILGKIVEPREAFLQATQTGQPSESQQSGQLKREEPEPAPEAGSNVLPPL